MDSLKDSEFFNKPKYVKLKGIENTTKNDQWSTLTHSTIVCKHVDIHIKNMSYRIHNLIGAQIVYNEW